MSRTKTGTISRDSTGAWRVRVTRSDGKRVMLRDKFQSESEAAAVAQACVEEMALTVDKSDPSTFARHARSWMAYRERTKAVRNPKDEQARYRLYIEGTRIDRLPIQAISRAHIREWADDLRSRKSLQTTKNTLQIVSGVLQAAYDTGLLKANHAKGIVFRRQASTKEHWTHLSLEEQQQLIRAADQLKGLGPLVAFAIATGLRAGEICALRLADVHPTHIVVRYGGVPDKPTKSGKIREVPLVAFAAEAIEQQRKRLAESRQPNKHGLLFPSPRGAFRPPANLFLTKDLKAMLRAAGIARHVRIHDLRHTCASSLVSGLWGRVWALHEVQAMLGHANAATTERYAHLAKTALKTAASQTHAMAMPAEPRTELIGNVIGNGSEASEAFYEQKSWEVRMGFEPTYDGFCKSIGFCK